MVFQQSSRPTLSHRILPLVTITLTYKNTLPPLMPSFLFYIIFTYNTPIDCHQILSYAPSWLGDNTTENPFTYPPHPYTSLTSKLSLHCVHTNHVTNYVHHSPLIIGTSINPSGDFSVSITLVLTLNLLLKYTTHTTSRPDSPPLTKYNSITKKEGRPSPVQW